MTVLSNGGSTAGTYSVTIPMGNAFPAGTEFTDIIACGKVKVASTGDFITSILAGMPQVLSSPVPDPPSVTMPHLTSAGILWLTSPCPCIPLPASS